MIRRESIILVPSSCKFHHNQKYCSTGLHTSEQLRAVEMPHNHPVPKFCELFPIFSLLYHHLQWLILCTHHNIKKTIINKSPLIILLTKSLQGYLESNHWVKHDNYLKTFACPIQYIELSQVQ